MYGHQESEYEVGKFVADEETSREQFVQGQKERLNLLCVTQGVAVEKEKWEGAELVYIDVLQW